MNISFLGCVNRIFPITLLLPLHLPPLPLLVGSFVLVISIRFVFLLMRNIICELTCTFVVAKSDNELT